MKIDPKYRMVFLGIGGIGMSALARYFLKLGHEVVGYDKTETSLTRQLTLEGCQIIYTDDVNLLPLQRMDVDDVFVVYTPAIPKQSALLTYFQTNGYTVQKRAELLGWISKNTQCIAIAGTHGKTTTSGILAHLLNVADLSFTAFLGGISEDINGNFIHKGRKWMVVEADEFDRSFLQLQPYIAVVTSMDADHLDIYENKANIEEAFTSFLNLVSPDGKRIVSHSLGLPGLSYGLEPEADYAATDIQIWGLEYHFTLKTPKGSFEEFVFPKPGRHNLSNAVAALSVAIEMGVKISTLRKALMEFKGIDRRFVFKIKQDDFLLIDDYAHHPAEIEAMYGAIREAFPEKHCTVIFQPHLFSRTKDFGVEFARILSCFDAVILLEIYPAREEPLEGINSQWLLDQINHTDKHLLPKEQLLPHLKKYAKDILITLGAGDISVIANELQKHYSYAC